MVGGRCDLSLTHTKSIVCAAAPLVCHGKAHAEFYALHGGNGKGNVRQLTFHTVEPRLAHACGQAGHNGFQHAAHTVALGGSGAHRLLHGGFPAGVQQGKMAVFRLGAHQPRRTAEGCILHPCQPGNVGVHTNAVPGQHALANAARRHGCSGHSAAEMPAAAGILPALIFGIGRIIGMARAQKIGGFGIVAAAGVGVGNGQRNGGARGVAIHHARKKFHLVRLNAGGGKPIAPGAAALHARSNVVAFHGQPGGQPVQHSADGRAVAFAEYR